MQRVVYKSALMQTIMLYGYKFYQKNKVGIV
jgi:hypothetical protein